MKKVSILIIEDEVEVRDAIVRDLKPFSGKFRIESAENIKEAEEVLNQVRKDGDALGLILCDHVLPGENGVEFLVRLNKMDWAQTTRKVLVTGQAGHEDTIRAINYANLDYYIAKPWKVEDLHKVVKKQLTNYIIDSEWDILPYVEILESDRLVRELGRRSADR